MSHEFNNGQNNQLKEAEFFYTENGAAIYSKCGDIVRLGETDETLDPCLTRDLMGGVTKCRTVAIKFQNRQPAIISDGMFVDLETGQAIDLFGARGDDPTFRFPDIMIGYSLDLFGGLAAPGGKKYENSASVEGVAVFGARTECNAPTYAGANELRYESIIRHRISDSPNARTIRGWRPKP
ncbi:hypothetical protein FWF93_01620 [Candidatus Saccharibacteria bacterium]|nr:hypothetical protein [Candidatus Saccharibacteria bacterium]